MSYIDCIVKPSISIKEAIRIIDKTSYQIVLIVENKKLTGLVTDGDIRRGLLRGENLNSPVENIMKKNFKYLNIGATKKNALDMMIKETLKQIPVIDEKKNLKNLFVIDDLIKPNQHDNEVVIMAGGKGTRLGSLTKNCPKPMLKVGKKPILENIITQCSQAGFKNLFISVNYLKEQIIDYFEDGSKWNVNISYLEENEPLGTAGSISLLPHEPKKSFLVINGDVLTKVDYNHLIDFHNFHKSDLSVCVTELNTQIPYGVLEIDNLEIKNFKEKPFITNYISAGIYLISPKLFSYIPKKTDFDFPDLIKIATEEKFKINAFPLYEYWQDIGSLENLNKSKKDDIW